MPRSLPRQSYAQPRLSRPLVALVAVAALAGTACRAVTTDVAVDEPGIMIDPPMGAEPGVAIATAEPAEQAPTLEPGDAVRDQPNPDAVNPRPIPWDRVSFDREASTLDVFWWSSGGCTMLSRIDVEYLDAEVVVTVIEGEPADSSMMMCVAEPMYFTHTLELAADPGERPFSDGAR